MHDMYMYLHTILLHVYIHYTLATYSIQVFGYVPMNYQVNSAYEVEDVGSC